MTRGEGGTPTCALVATVTIVDSDGTPQTLRNPMGIFIDDRDDLYVADTDQDRVLVLSPARVQEGALSVAHIWPFDKPLGIIKLSDHDVFILGDNGSLASLRVEGSGALKLKWQTKETLHGSIHAVAASKFNNMVYVARRSTHPTMGELSTIEMLSPVGWLPVLWNRAADSHCIDNCDGGVLARPLLPLCPTEWAKGRGVQTNDLVTITFGGPAGAAFSVHRALVLTKYSNLLDSKIVELLKTVDVSLEVAAIFEQLLFSGLEHLPLLTRDSAQSQRNS